VKREAHHRTCAECSTSAQKNCIRTSIFLDTLFGENYTFDSCNEHLATHTLDHRENRQNGNEKGSQESREEGRKEEVVQQANAARGTHFASPLLRL
jgi:hypothetical protein